MRRSISIPVGILVCVVFMAPAALAANRPSASSVSGVARGYAFAGYSVITTGASPGSGSSVVGPLAPTLVDCSITAATVTQNTANASIGSMVSAGAGQDVVDMTRSLSSISSQAKSTVHNVDILRGLISASSITAVANSTGTQSAATSSNGSSFSGLSVLGLKLSATPAPNTTVKLPGLGAVVLNEQFGPSNSFSATSINVNALDVYVTVANSLGLGVGSRIIIGHADSYFQRTAQSSLVGASSYSVYSLGTGSNASASTGLYMPTEIGCLGGNTQVQSTSFSSSTLGNTGDITDSASGQITANGSQSSAQSNISSLNFLSGLIQGDNITVQANAGWNGRGSASATTTLRNMSIHGTKLSQSPAPNTTYSLAGLGTLTLNVQYIHITSTSVWSEVVGMLIKVTQTNSFGLPIGAEIIIGHAAASVSA